MDRFLELFGNRFTAYMWLAICPINMYTAWQGNSAGKAQKAWEKHAETYEGTMQMLNDMHRLYTLPREKRMNKGFFIFWLVMELVWIGLLIWEGLK